MNQNEIIVIEYEAKQKAAWDEFVDLAKNKHFFFHRDYMDYHSDRFIDNSLLFYYKDKLIALLPANQKEQTLVSHGGLTFGGFIINNTMKTPLMIECFNSLKTYCIKKQINRIIYKAIPYIYHTLPAQEDLYALFRSSANLIRRDVTTTIKLDEEINYQTLRKRNIKEAGKNNTSIFENHGFEEYWVLLEKVLWKNYKIKPTHNFAEILMLKMNFPNNIILHTAFFKNQLVAGVVLFVNANIVHAQYIVANDLGKQNGALDLLFDYLIKKYLNKKLYFDFGISNEDDGLYLNEGLIFQKEGFGGRAVVHDFYEIKL